MQKLLIVDDSVPFMNDVEFVLKDKYKIFKAESGKKGLSVLHKEDINFVLLDLKLPDIHGLEVLEKIHTEIDPLLPVIIITDYGDIQTAVKAMKLGAADFIPKDFNRDVLIERISQAFEKRELNIKLNALEAAIDEDSDKFIVAGEAARKILLDIERFANQDVHILLTGETGVGKDGVAREIHLRSNRRNKLFVKVSLHTLSESLIESELFGHEKGAFSGADEAKIGRFEAANGGTIYLPEISEVSEKIQLKLLKFMQYKEISKVGQRSIKDIKLDVRLILASNKNLEQLVEQGKLREDFYYRIKIININIPPLRERRDEIKGLAEYFLRTLSVKFGKKGLELSDEAVKAMENYYWKGNVRELQSFMTNVVIRANDNEVIELDSLPEMPSTSSNETPGDESYRGSLNRFKKEYFSDLLKKTNGVMGDAAEAAGISRQALHKILKELDLGDVDS
ncbi:MAG: sigma-54 dependent transcriptional regulator [Bacteroidetes bacterium]|nr:sigma-54 dependent transcriptional regulator [Bacteroidota bacterium]MCL5738694.1 sigma-54 dependent transcriptional regulator [Bacteroidota bacterium]